MYSHTLKGVTLGHVLTRRLLRSLTSIPGIILDLSAALFWVPDYSSYWDNYLEYGDGVKTGVMEGIFGWIGEGIGYVLGGAVGAVIGSLVYFPDSFLRGVSWLYEKTNDLFNRAANMIGEREFFHNTTFEKPNNYMQKAWNISAATLGTIIAAPLFVPLRAIEFVLPFLGHGLSNFAWNTAAVIGGGVGVIAAAALYPAKYMADRLVDGYKNLRDGIRSFSAFVYAKGQQNIYDQGDCLPDHTVHSQEFRDQYARMKNTSTTQILFGKMRDQNDEVKPLLGDPLSDPITLERLVDPVIDPHGHTFSRSTITTWLQKKSTCPLSNEPLTVNQLVPNRALDETLHLGNRMK